MNDKKLRWYWKMITDIWKLFRKYSNPDSSSQFWKSYKAEVDRLNKKYDGSELFKNLAIAVTKELTRVEEEVKQ